MKKLITLLLFLIAAVGTNAQQIKYIDPIKKDTVFTNYQVTFPSPVVTATTVIHYYKQPVIPPVVVPPVITLPASGTTVIGKINSGPVTLKSNTDYQDLIIDGGGMQVTLLSANGVSNIHIHKLKLQNTKGFAGNFYNCTNITIDSCFIDNVGFGIYAYKCGNIFSTQYCQFKDINGINANSLGHAVQYNAVNGSGIRCNYNRVENTKMLTDTSSHPHDQLNFYQVNGMQGDSAQMIGNWVRGGQLKGWPKSSYTGAGIIMNDEGGSFQVCRKNILVNCGCDGIQSNSFSSGIACTSTSIDHNIIYNDITGGVAANGINILGTHQNVTVSYNRINWTNAAGKNVNNPDGTTNIYFGNPQGTHTGTTLAGNIYNDKTVTKTSDLPTIMITFS